MSRDVTPVRTVVGLLALAVVTALGLPAGPAGARTHSAVTVGSAATSPATPTAVKAEPWAQFHADAAKTGWNGTEHTLTASAVRRFTEQWVVADGALVGSPIVVGGTVYAVFLTTDDVGGTTTVLRAVRASDGAALWTAPLPGYPIFPPAALAYVDGRVLVVVDGVLEGYTADSGTLTWLSPVGQSRGPTIVGTTVYVGASDGIVRALSATDGRVVWSVTLPGEVHSAVSYAEGLVYAAAADQLFALDAGTGAQVWQALVGDVYGGGAAVLDGVAYIAANPGRTGGTSARLTALDARTGRQLWVAGAGDDVHSLPAVDGDRVYIGAIDGQVRAFAAKTGAPRWTRSVGGEVWSSAAVAAGVVYVTTDTDDTFALAARTGAVLWSATPQGPGAFAAMGSPAVARGTLYVADGQSGLRAYRPAR